LSFSFPKKWRSVLRHFFFYSWWIEMMDFCNYGKAFHE